ncbi:MAG: hypothetical protein EXR72_20660 [Myxococcales bacterium]|nr:hypothetical protein [Myxococcales bacterium]
MSEQGHAARLAHDVGKYIARTARNLPPGAPLDEELSAMLARDLYDLDGMRASERFARLAAPLLRDARLDEARALLAEVDGLEPALRARDPAAVARAAAIALTVERLLRALAREAAP